MLMTYESAENVLSASKRSRPQEEKEVNLNNTKREKG